MRDWKLVVRLTRDLDGLAMRIAFKEGELDGAAHGATGRCPPRPALRCLA